MASIVCSRAAVFTSWYSLGLPFGLPDVPFGNGLPRGFILRTCCIAADVAKSTMSYVWPASGLRDSASALRAICALAKGYALSFDGLDQLARCPRQFRDLFAQSDCSHLNSRRASMRRDCPAAHRAGGSVHAADLIGR